MLLFDNYEWSIFHNALTSLHADSIPHDVIVNLLCGIGGKLVATVIHDFLFFHLYDTSINSFFYQIGIAGNPGISTSLLIADGIGQ